MSSLFCVPARTIITKFVSKLVNPGCARTPARCSRARLPLVGSVAAVTASCGKYLVVADGLSCLLVYARRWTEQGERMGGADVGVVLGQRWFPVSTWRAGGCKIARSAVLFARPAVCRRVHQSSHTRSCAFASAVASRFSPNGRIFLFTPVAQRGGPPRPSTRFSRRSSP